MQKRFNPLLASISALALITTAACSGSGSADAQVPVANFPVSGVTSGASPPPLASATASATTGVSTVMEDPEDVARFMMKASFGAPMETLENLAGTDAADWISNQMSLPQVPYRAQSRRVFDTGAGLINDSPFQRSVYNQSAALSAQMTSDDVLRQRMMFALSQIFVINLSSSGPATRPHRESDYLEILSKNAFGNFRDLLEDITYSPAMANYLTYTANRKADPATGRMPDENYAREILQLFTIGLVELEQNGTVVTDANGPVEVYDNSDVEGLARVFTGLSYDIGRFRSFTTNPDANSSRLVMFDSQHEDGEKAFLDTVIPAGTAGDESIEIALDAIFAHPNVAPFISRQLIQRFTSSSPRPPYVRRVSAAFNSGTFIAPNGVRFGTGEHGDLAATLAAILLDAENFVDLDTVGQRTGKIREPILRFAHWARAFDISNASPAETLFSFRNRGGRRIASPTEGIGQIMMGAPSVFNFYRPGFVQPGSQSGRLGLTTPELQLSNEGATVGYINFMSKVAGNGSNRSTLLLPDYQDELALANNARALVGRLNLLLTANRMSDAEIEGVINVINATPINSATEARDRFARVQAAVTAVASLPSYAVAR